MQDCARYVEEMTRLRREIHRRPEEGWTEFETQWKVFRALEALGWTIRVGLDVIRPEAVMGRNAELVEKAMVRAAEHGVPESFLKATGGYTGLTADFDTGREGPVTGFRFDMDCVLVEELHDASHLPAAEGFDSEISGHMHACGHDGHQAVAFELGRFIVANRDRLTGRIRFIFQPGEEGSRGAYPIVQSGLLDDVDTLLCAHIATDLQAGTVVAAPEKFLCTTKIDLHFEGVQAHAGMQPQLGRNALLAAADAALILMALPRHSDGMTRVNVGTLHAGEGRNVIAAHADMEVEVRGENEAINRELAREAVTRAQGCAMAFGVKMSHKIMGEAVDFVPDDGIVQMITVCARRARYVREVRPSVPLNGSDDATLMIRRVQSQGGRAGYFLVGAGLEASHEHAAVDFDERYLVTLYDIFANLVIGLSGNW